MTPDTLLRNHYNCLLMFLCPILLVMGVDLLHLWGIWFFKATTEGLLVWKERSPIPFNKE